MTMLVRITNESAHTNYEAKVRVFDKNEDGSEVEVVNEGRTLAVGESAAIYVHSHRSIKVEEVQAT